MMRSSISCALAMSMAAEIFSSRLTESGWILTSASICLLTTAGSNWRVDLASPDAFLTAASAAFMTASLSNDVTVPYPHLPPIHALRHTPPVLFSTSCLSPPLRALIPVDLIVWDLASQNSAPKSFMRSTAAYNRSCDCCAASITTSWLISNHRVRMVERCEDLTTVLRDQNRVLDPYPADSGDVDAGLCGHDVSCVQGLLGPVRDVDGLMDLLSDTVSEGVDELALELRLIDHLACGQVRCVSLGSVTVLRDTCQLCLPYDLVCPLEEGVGISEEHRACHVGTVPVPI